MDNDNPGVYHDGEFLEIVPAPDAAYARPRHWWNRRVSFRRWLFFLLIVLVIVLPFIAGHWYMTLPFRADPTLNARFFRAEPRPAAANTVAETPYNPLATVVFPARNTAPPASTP